MCQCYKRGWLGQKVLERRARIAERQARDQAEMLQRQQVIKRGLIAMFEIANSCNTGLLKEEDSGFDTPHDAG